MPYFINLFEVKGDKMTEETIKEIKFVQTHHEKTLITEIDAWDMGKYMYRLLENSEEKDKVIKALIEEVCYLSHFIAKSHPEYIDFLNKARNVEISSDDSLEWNLNPPQIPDGVEIKASTNKEKEEVEKQRIEW